MQFVALVYQKDMSKESVPEEEWRKIYAEYQAVGKELREKGQLVAGYGLQPVSAAKTVRSRNGEVKVQEGPAYGTEDYLSGVNLIEAPDMDAALKIAGKLPSVRWGSVEIRPLMEYKATAADTYKGAGRS